MTQLKTKRFPKSRITTIDVGQLARSKHHVTALLEIDVTDSRQRIKNYKKEIAKISFTAWLIKAICTTIKKNPSITAFLRGKRNLVIFDDINVSVIVEKELNGERVPIPLLIEKANEKSIELLTQLISDSKDNVLDKNEIVLQRKTTKTEQLYYYLPGFIRRFIWHFMLKHPKIIFKKMGNVSVTSVGATGKVNGWFIPFSVHPICFGINSIIKKPVVRNDKIEIREIMNMTLLLDHDVIDGAPMARFVKELVKNIEKGILL